MGWLDSRNNTGLALNKRELAEAIDLSERTLTEWQSEGMPILALGGPGSENTYDLAEVVRWACLREIGKRGIQSAFDRLNDIRAKREEINLKRDLHQIVFIPDIRPAFQRYVNDIMATLIGLPEKYAAQLEQTQGVEGKHQVLSDAVEEIREIMGNYEFSAATHPGGDSAATQPAEDHAGAVG
jgi:phage terminase Nu1 subunit (DNA packaging protein)